MSIVEDFVADQNDRDSWIASGHSDDARLDWYTVVPNSDEARQWTKAGFTPVAAAHWLRTLQEPLLRVLSTAIEWANAGYGAEEARAWRDARVTSAATAEEFSAIGLSPQEARPWVGLDPAVVPGWAAAGIDPAEAWPWGRSTPYSTAAAWMSEGLTAEQYQAWGTGYQPPAPDPTVAKAWISAGHDATSAKAWNEAGIRSASHAQRWLDAGFDAADAATWHTKTVRLPAERARRLRDAGIPREAWSKIRGSAVDVDLAIDRLVAASPAGGRAAPLDGRLLRQFFASRGAELLRARLGGDADPALDPPASYVVARTLLKVLPGSELCGLSDEGGVRHFAVARSSYYYDSEGVATWQQLSARWRTRLPGGRSPWVAPNSQLNDPALAAAVPVELAAELANELRRWRRSAEARAWATEPAEPALPDPASAPVALSFPRIQR